MYVYSWPISIAHFEKASTPPDIILTPASPTVYDPRNDLPHQNGDGLSPPSRDSIRQVPTPVITEAPPLDLLKTKVSIHVGEVDPEPHISAVDGERPTTTPPRTAHHELCLDTPSTLIAQRLTYRLSTVFDTTTVIHRPNLASRPTVLPEYSWYNPFNSDSPFGLQDNNSTLSRASSVHHSSNFTAPASPASSAPTSFTSSSQKADHTWHIQHGAASFGSAGGRFKPLFLLFLAKCWIVTGLPSIPELHPKVLEFPILKSLHPLSVSIATAESTAAAKVFLETYFNMLLATSISPRSQRRRILESKLFTLPMSTEERQAVRRRWLQAESDNLRLTRALSSKATGRKKSPTDHYEVIRVLGKGSFGVVRLVREKTHRLRLHSTLDKKELENEVDPDQNPQTNRCGFLTNQTQVYAMKVIRKSDMIRNSQEGHLRAERDFLIASAHSRWIVPLVASFQDHGHLYLVMEYMVGGDFLGLLLREDVLPEQVSRWYVAEMILCIEEAHKMKWIHRDVKPDNFLISTSGHLKISDFGLAFDGHWSHHQQYYSHTRESLVELLGIPVSGDQKDVEDDMQQQTSRSQAKTAHGVADTHALRSNCLNRSTYRPEGDFVLDQLNETAKRKLARSIVGTSQYMAPEVIQGEFYDGRCDWWSIGIILYEVRPDGEQRCAVQLTIESACMEPRPFTVMTEMVPKPRSSYTSQRI